MNERDGDHVAQRLRWALQALAAPADDQLRRAPAFAALAESLAIDFDTWYGIARRGSALPLSAAQQDALAAIDRRFARMSGHEHVDLWGADALRTAPAWAELRTLAAAALQALGWPQELPPPGADVYLPGEAP